MDFYSPEDYVIYKYQNFGICNENKQSFGEVFWNNISMEPFISVKHQCKKCKYDTQLFFQMEKNENVSNFENLYNKHGNERKVKCDKRCFWYDWFKNLRKK